MPAPVSIVIPTLNAAEALPATAATLLEGVTSGLVRDMVISDGGSQDATCDVARELGAIIVEGAAGRGGQIARGVEAATGQWLLILHSDTHLSPGWSEIVLAHTETQPRKAGYFRLRFRAEGFAPLLIATGANLRSRFLGLPYGDQGLLIRRDLLLELGGVPELPLMEDVALARRLKGNLQVLSADARTSPERYITDGWTRRSVGNLWTLARYFAGVSPDRLRADYARRSQSSEN